MLTGIAGLNALSVGALMLPSVFWPSPKQIQARPNIVITCPANISAPKQLSKPAALLQTEMNRSLPRQNTLAKDRTKIVFQISNKDLTRSEEYVLDASGKTVLIKVHDEQGAFWAVHSLLQLIKSESARQSDKGFEFPGVKLHDWPESKFRAFMIQAAWNGTPEELKENLDLLARMKVKYFALEFGPRVILDCDPAIARASHPGLLLTKKQAKQIIDYGRSLGLEPIGYLNTLAHLERAYQKPPYTDHGGIMIQNQESYDKFVFPVLSEMLEVYGPVKYFHCGMDEAWEMFTYYSQQNLNTSELISRHISKLNDFFQSRGIRMVMWHDMLLSPDSKSRFGDSIGPANGGEPFNTASAISSIPKSVILDYWNYDPFEKYPVIDYLKNQGFEVWSSPWYVPFSLVNYSTKLGVPTMGTLWTDPPSCFYVSPYDAAIALYAQAAWNPSKCRIGGEPNAKHEALDATYTLIFGRPKVGIQTGKHVKLISGAKPFASKDVVWPKRPTDVIMSYGVPFDFSAPAIHQPITLSGKPIESPESAAYIVISGGQRFQLDGVNTDRGEDQLILYAAPRSSTKTNIYGTEVAVSSSGEVISVAGYGSNDTKIPTGGFVLSAHSGPSGEKANRLLRLKEGDHITVFDKDGNWIGGYRPIVFWTKLPNGETLRIDSVDDARGLAQLVLYEYGYGNNRTGTNQYGVEVAVIDGEIIKVEQGVGNMEIPAGGYVLSVHNASPAATEKGLLGLKPGDKVQIVADINGTQADVWDIVIKNKWQTSTDCYAETVLFASAAKVSLLPGTAVGTFEVKYTDGTTSRTVLKYGEHVLAESGNDCPTSMAADTWLMHPGKPYEACMVYEWTNPKPGSKISSVQFLPNLYSIQAGNTIYGATIVGR